MTNTIKNKLIVALVVGGLGVAGIAYYTMNKQSGSVANTNETGTPQDTLANQSNPLFSSIEDAMQRGLTLECTFAEDGKSSTAYIKGSKVRMTVNGTDKNSPNNFLLLNNSMFIWASGSTKGFIVSIDAQTAQQVQKQTQGAEDVDKATNTDVLGSLEKYKSTCKESKIADSEFEKPTDIQFIDFNDLYKTK